MSLRFFVCLIIITVLSMSAAAAIIDIGTGVNNAGLYIEWKDGFTVEFAVNFDTASLTGWELFDAVKAETTLDTVVENFGWGDFIDGISYEGHNNVGFGGGADWWHYWIMDAPSTDWVSPAFGISDRTLYDGDMDGWVYGSDFIPEPGTMALLAFGGLLLRKRRR